MRVLIVDDEAYVHDYVQNIISQKLINMAVSGHAYDGNEAFHQVMEDRPDIIMTDMKMPFSDGLTFMEKLKNEGFPGKIIVLSGYSDFSYSRPAFLMNAFDYILKPIDEMKIAEVLTSAHHKLLEEKRISKENKAWMENAKSLIQEEFLSKILYERYTDVNELYVRADQLNIYLPESNYFTIIIKLFDQQEEKEFFNDNVKKLLSSIIPIHQTILFTNRLSINEYVILVNSKETLSIGSILKGLSFLKTNGNMKAGGSTLKKKLIDLPDSYQEAKHNMNQLTLHPDYRIEPLEQGNSEIKNMWDDLLRITDCFVKSKSKHYASILEDTFNTVFQKYDNTRIKEWEHYVNLFKRKLDRLGQENAEYQNHIRHFESLMLELQWREASAFLKAALKVLTEMFTFHKTNEELITLIKDYTEKNYDTVNLQVIADKFYVSKNYFCSLFKERTGENFGEFLTRIKLERAKIFLKESELKNYEIAELVGYRDQRYFSQVFRKYTGYQPSLYRSQLKEK
ncbi:response regulator [Salibacterium aidingense]|uniref:response regulator n=1 Tax=Salibacterium aidingense TaxID=384933 RepID=UPI003BDA3CF2